MTPLHPEIGRELLYPDLHDRVGTVLALQKDGGTLFATMWLVEVSPILVFFHAGIGNTTLGLTPQPDGTLQDVLNRQIRVFEYLGQV